MIERGVTGNPEDPRRKWNLALLVFFDPFYKLCEDVLGDVLGLVVVVDETCHIAQDIWRVAGI